MNDEVATAINDNTTIVKQGPYTASILSVSREIRFEIYRYLINGSGVINVWSGKSTGRYTDRTTIALLHVNRLIRIEVEEFFYRTQTFQFRSLPAIKSFINRVGQHLVTRIRSIELGWWLYYVSQDNFIAQIGQYLKQFTSLEQIHLQGGDRWWQSARREAQYKVNGELIPQSALRVLAVLATLPNMQGIDLYWMRVKDTWGNFVSCQIYLISKGKEFSDLKCQISGPQPELITAAGIRHGLKQLKLKEEQVRLERLDRAVKRLHRIPKIKG